MINYPFLRILFLALLINSSAYSYQNNDRSPLEYLAQGSDEVNPKKALSLLNQAYRNVYEMKDSVEATLYFELAVAHGKLYHVDSAIYFFEQALSLATTNSWRLMEISTLNGLGNVARIDSDNQLAMQYFHSGLELTGASQDKVDLEWSSKLLGNLAGIYFDLSEFETALKYSLQALVMAKQTKNDQSIAYGYSQLGYLYSELDSLDKALKCGKQSIAYFQNAKDSLGMVYQYYSLATAYYQMRDLENAKSHYEISFELAEKFGEAETFLGSLNQLGNIAMDKKRYQIAEQYAFQALNHQYSTRLKIHRKSTYDLLYNIALANEQYKTALEYRNQYIALSDSLLNEKEVFQISALTPKYEAEMNKSEINSLRRKNKLAEADLRNTSIIRNVILAIAVLIIAFILFVNLNQKKKFKLKESNFNYEMHGLQLKLSSLLGEQKEMSGTFDSINAKIANPLTQREFEVLELTFANQSNKQIATQLFVSVNTVKTHLKNVFDKLGVINRKEALEKVLGSKN